MRIRHGRAPYATRGPRAACCWRHRLLHATGRIPGSTGSRVPPRRRSAAVGACHEECSPSCLQTAARPAAVSDSPGGSRSISRGGWGDLPQGDRAATRPNSARPAGRRGGCTMKADAVSYGNRDAGSNRVRCGALWCGAHLSPPLLVRAHEDVAREPRGHRGVPKRECAPNPL